MTVSLSHQHFGGSSQSSELTTFLNERESCSSKTMRWKYVSCIGVHFLRALPCYPIGQERSTSWLLGGSNPELSLLLKISCHFLFSAASSNRFRSVRESPSGFRVKVLGPESSSAIFVPKKIPPPLRLELPGCVSSSQIYLDSSTNEIKLPLYQGLDLWRAKHNTLYCLSGLVTHFNQSVCTAAKVNFNNESRGSGWITADQFHLATQTRTAALV